MRNSRGGTSSSTKKSQNIGSSNEEKNSAKKLVQARLPFKIITPGSPPVATVSAASAEIDGKKEGNAFWQSGHRDTIDRKRKLSYESDDDVGADHEEGGNMSKENVEVIAAASKKKKITTTSSEIVVVSLLDDDEDDDDKTATVTESKEKSKLRTPKTAAKAKSKGAGTPQTSSSAHKDKGNSASKLLIKLPLSGGKKSKRRKSKSNSNQANSSFRVVTNQQNKSGGDSSDDIEEVSCELNPQKRKKLDYVERENAAEYTTKENETSCLDSELGYVGENKEKRDGQQEASPTAIKSKSETQHTQSSLEKEHLNVVEEEKDENTEEDLEDSVLIASDDDEADDDADDDADDETENTHNKNDNLSSDIGEESKSRHNATTDSIKDLDNKSLKEKNLTPKQKKLMERRQKAREEKERKIQEEKKKKQQEKEEKELSKKREREEKEEQRRKEREEKEEQKRKEREEKERKRVAEVEAKNEEKRKRTEAKEEEVRKKDEERKRKEQEKEEAEIKKKKAAEAFTKFFVAKTPSTVQQNIEDDESTGDGTKILAFRPFQIKGDMKLAPICRKVLTKEAKHRIDSILAGKGGSFVEMDNDRDDEDIVRAKPLPKSELYLSELRSGKILPGKWRRPSTESKDDVVIIEDELERVGEAIVEDIPAYRRDEMRVKFYKFHDNRRPPYYGTWRKQSSVIKAKKPFAQDKKFFDYDVDSDDEWEEEEPGESLEDGSDDDKEKESEDDDYEVDNEWFVPHGHLSDEEIQNEDECGNGDDNTREAQKAKLQILQQEFAQEMKKKTEKIKPRLIGCIWINKDGNQPEECPKIIWDTLNIRAMLCTDPPILDEPEVEEPSSPFSSNTGNADKSANDKVKPIAVNDVMLKDLIRLLHGNNHSKNFLIKEYSAYVMKTEESVKNGKFGLPLKTIRDKIDSIAEWQAVEATAASITQQIGESNESTKRKKKNKKRLCWVVNKETLEKMDMSTLHLQNTWEYVLTPKLSRESTKPPDEGAQTTSVVTTKDGSSTTDNKIDNKTKNTTSQITKFTKVLTAEEKATKLENSKTRLSSNTSPKNTTIENKVKTPASKIQTPSEKKRVSLLMSVGRDQKISTPAKNKLISQFLRKGNQDKNCLSKTHGASSPVADDDEVVILD